MAKNSSKILEEVDRKWAKSSSRKMTYQKMQMYYHGLTGFEELFGYTHQYMLYRVIDGEVVTYVDRKEMTDQNGFFLKKFMDKKFLVTKIKKLGQRIEKDFDAYDDYLKTIPQDWTGFSDAQLIKILKHHNAEDDRISAYYWVLFNDIEEIMDSSMKKMMSDEGIKEKEMKKIIGIISDPISITPLDMEKVSLLGVAFKDGKEQKIDLERHRDSFSFMPMYDIDYAPYSLEYFAKELRKIKRKFSKKEIVEEIAYIMKKYQKRKEDVGAILKNYKSKPELFSIMSFYSAFASLKDRKPYVRDQSSYYTRNLFIEIGKRLRISLSETLFLTEHELEKSIKEEKVSVKKQDLRKRMKNSVFLFKDNEVIIFTGKSDLDQIDAFLKEDFGGKELKGMGVSGGIVTGEVTIVLNNNNFSKFKEGQILVTGATRPDFVPLMKKAAAIIADEGGLLSHAAIVSRELKKPCIVGTKIATQVLKDGDLVEVDADKGVVIILKS
jgi:phosphoenolpyruvate synthase/pyruvate phosphate dikinase